MNDMNLQGTPRGLAQAYDIVRAQGLPINNATIQQVYDSLMRGGSAEHFNNATAKFNDATASFDRIAQMLSEVPGLDGVSSVGGEVGTNLASGNGLRTQSSPTTVVQPGHPPRYDNIKSTTSQVGTTGKSARISSDRGGKRNENNEGDLVDNSTRTAPTHNEVPESPRSEPDNDADDSVATTAQQLGTGDSGSGIEALLALVPGLGKAFSRQSSPEVITAPRGGLPTHSGRPGMTFREPLSVEDALLSHIPGMGNVPEQFAAQGSVEGSVPVAARSPTNVDAPINGEVVRPLLPLLPQQLNAPASTAQVGQDQRAQVDSTQRTQIGQPSDMQTVATKPVSVDSQGTARVGQRVGNQTKQPTKPQVVNDYATIPVEQNADSRAAEIVDRLVGSQQRKAPQAQPEKAQAASQQPPVQQTPQSPAKASSTADSLADSVAEKTSASDAKVKRIQPRDMQNITNKFKVELANAAPDYDQVTVERAVTRGRNGSTDLVVKKGSQELGRFKTSSDLMNAVKDIAAALKRLR